MGRTCGFGENKGVRQDEIQLDYPAGLLLYGRNTGITLLTENPTCWGQSDESSYSTSSPDGLTRLSGSRASLIESSKSFITGYWGERGIIITVRSSSSCLLNEGRKKAQKGSPRRWFSSARVAWLTYRWSIEEGNFLNKYPPIHRDLLGTPSPNMLVSADFN